MKRLDHLETYVWATAQIGNFELEDGETVRPLWGDKLKGYVDDDGCIVFVHHIPCAFMLSPDHPIDWSGGGDEE